MTIYSFATLFLLSLASGIVGIFLFLKQRTLEVDVLVHSVFPGVAAAFLISQSRDLPVMIAGGMVASVAALICVRILRHFYVPLDSSLGITAVTFFSLGVILISFVPSVDIDPNCVLFGTMEFLSFETLPLFGSQIPQGFLQALVVCLIVCGVIATYYRELMMYSFDETYSKLQGVKNIFIEALLVSMISLVSITSFHIAGTVLVLVQMVTLPLIARLCAYRVSTMLMIILFSAGLSSFLGSLTSDHLNLSSAPIVSGVSLMLVIFVLFLSPQQGILSRFIKSQWIKILIARDDVLSKLYRDMELGARHYSLKNSQWIFFGKLVGISQGYLKRDPAGVLNLSVIGKQRAEMLIRSHRLWELYLHDELNQEKDHVHASSDRAEHFISKDVSTSLTETYDASTKDPHGREIP